MRDLPQKISNRTFVLCLAFPLLACVIAFFVCYGRNIAWCVYHFNQPLRAPLGSVSLNSSVANEEFFACSFLNLELDVPASMARSAKIVESSGTRWLEFSDLTRKIRIPLSSNEAQRTGFGAIPPSIDKLTNTELMVFLYKKGTQDFSVGMNRTKLQEHDWAMNCRNLFAYEQQLDNMSYMTRGDFQLLVLSATAIPSVKRTSKWIAFSNWSLADKSDGGMVYFFDEDNGNANWAYKSATSLRRSGTPSAVTVEAFEKLISSSTNDELLQVLKISTPAVLEATDQH